MTDEQIHEEIVTLMKVLGAALGMVNELNERIADPERRVNLSLFMLAKNDVAVERAYSMIGDGGMNAAAITFSMLENEVLHRAVTVAVASAARKDIQAEFAEIRKTEINIKNQ